MVTRVCAITPRSAGVWQPKSTCQYRFARGAGHACYALETITDSTSAAARDDHRRHHPNSEDADDVTQEVLFRLHTRLDSYKGRSRFTTWLYQVTRNAAYEVRRRRSTRARFREKLGQMETDDNRAATVAEQPDHGLVAAIWALFQRLPARQRQIFDLADLQGFTPAEIGEMLDMNPVTVRANLCKARRAIRSRLLERHPQIIEELGR